jgi:prefoldin subunit 5
VKNVISLRCSHRNRRQTLSAIDEEISALKARISSLQITKARAEATKQAAQENYHSALARLQAEFGVDNLGAARAKLDELQEDLRRKMGEVTTILNQINL